MTVLNTADALYVGAEAVEAVYLGLDQVYASGPLIRLTGRTVAETAATGTTVGTLSVVNATGTPTFTLTDSAGGKFAITGALLKTNAALDYETATFHTITVHVTGMTPTVADRTFIVLVTDVVEPVIVLTGTSISESASIGAIVGTLSIANAYTGTPVFTLPGSAGGKFAVSGNNLTVAGALDFETAPSHSITVAVSGITPAAANKPFTITVTDVLELDPVLQLTGTTVNEDAAVNTTVGTISLTGTYTGSPVYTLTDSAGGKFNISGALLRVNAALDYETATTHSVTVAVSGITPAAANKAFTVVVLDITEATGATFDPGAKSTLIALSGGNLTATALGTAGSSAKTVRATVSKTTGKYFCKFTIVEITSLETEVSICNASTPVEGPTVPGSTDAPAHGCGYISNGYVIYDNGTFGGLTYGPIDTYTTGDVISMAVDLTAERIWFRKNALLWNNSGSADPATGVGGFDISAAIQGDAFFPAVSFKTEIPNIGDVTADFSGTGAPSGFDPWGGGGTVGTTKNIVTHYGAVADGGWASTTLSITSGTNMLTAGSAIWTSGDVGKAIVIPGIPFVTSLQRNTITAVGGTPTGSQVTLALNCPFTHTNFPCIVSWGTNNGKTSDVDGGGVDGPFATFRNEFQGQAVTLTIPAGIYLVGNGNFGGLFDGIRNITCNAAGATLCGGAFQIQASAQYQAAGHMGYTASVSAGATQVMLTNPSADVSKFTVGGYAMMSGFDMQHGGYPTNQALFEYLLITAIDSDSGSPTYGRITFLTPLVNSYLSTWPVFYTGEMNYGGPASLYAMNPKFNHISVVNDLTIAQQEQYGVSGLQLTFNNCVFKGEGQLGPHMTMAKTIVFNNCDLTGMSIEVDKLCESVTSIGSTWGGLYVQSSSINELILDDTDVVFTVFTPRKLIIRNGCTIGTLIPGPVAYGYADELEVSDSHIGYFGSDTYHGSGIEFRSGDAVFSGDGIEEDFTMSGGVITIPQTMRLTGASQWAMTGGRVNFWDANLGSLGLFTITDVTDTGTDILVHTDWARIGGAFPPSTYVDGLWLVTHNVARCTFDNVDGNPEVEMLSDLPANTPLGSRYLRTFDGSVVNSGFWQLRGRIKKVVVAVPTAYSGPTLVATATLVFGNAAIKMSDGSNVPWNQVINLKTTGTRTFDVDVDPYPTAWSGGVTGDTLTGMSEALWSTSNFYMVMTDITAETVPPTVRPVFTVEVITDLGF